MKVYITYRSKAQEFADYLENRLEQAGHTVLNAAKTAPGFSISDAIAEMIAEADAILAVFCGQNNDNIAYEVGVGLSDLNKLVIPILYQDAVVPFALQDRLVIRVADARQYDEAASTVLYHLAAHEAKQQQEATQQREAAQRLERGIKTHVEEVLENLKGREKRNKRYAFWLYACSLLMLAAVVVFAALLLSRNSLAELELERLIVLGVLYLFIAILMVSISKFMFTLARSFMVEAIRASDRIHAISFGKFYLEAFDEKVTREELIQIFGTWNIDNGATLFREQSPDDYDPKLLEKLLDTIGLAKKSS